MSQEAEAAEDEKKEIDWDSVDIAGALLKMGLGGQ
jgi:hypothetical protein